MDRMNPLDAAFLQAEDEEPQVSLAIASIAVFEGPAPTTEEFRATLAGRLPLIPRYRQKAREVPFDLGPPVWVDDPGFDLRRLATIELRGRAARQATVTELRHDDITAHNTFEDPDVLHPGTRELETDDAPWRHTFAPASVTVLQIRSN